MLTCYYIKSVVIQLGMASEDKFQNQELNDYTDQRKSRYKGKQQQDKGTKSQDFKSSPHFQHGFVLKVHLVSSLKQNGKESINGEGIMGKEIIINEDYKEVTEKLTNGDTDQAPEKEVPSKLPLKNRLREDKSFKKKIIIFVCISYSFFILGWNVGQFGPTLLDLQMIAGCTLDQASFLFNGTTIGYLVASLSVGLLFDRFNKLLQLLIPLLVLTGVMASIPWCTIYEMMVVMHVLKGYCMGIVDGVGNALMLHLLGPTVKIYMQIAHFMFAFGGIISPLISAPFLSKKQITPVDFGGNTTVVPIVSVYTSMVAFNSTLWNVSGSQNITDEEIMNMSSESEVFKAYIVSAIMTLTSALPFLFLYFGSEESTCPTTKDHNEEHKSDNISLHLKVLILVILCFIIASYTATEDTFAGFLTTFTVKHFGWSKVDGAFATSVFWTSFAVGRFLGIFIVSLFKQVKLLFTYSFMMIVSFVLLLLSSLYLIEELLWISSALTGFAMSIFFPIFFSWTEENFFHVDGKVTALIMTCACAGVIVNPIILSRVMDDASVWFSYILLVESAILFTLFITSVYIARLIKRAGHNSIELTVELPAISSSEDSKL